MPDQNPNKVSDDSASNRSSSQPRPTSASLIVTISELPEGVVIHIEGPANTETAHELQRVFLPLTARRPPVTILDCARLTFLTSLVMGMLVSLRRDLGRWGGRVRIAAVSPEVLEALQVSRLAELFEFFDTLDAATAS